MAENLNDKPLSVRLLSGVAGVIMAIGVAYWYMHDTPANRAAIEHAFMNGQTEAQKTAQAKEATKQKRLEFEIAKVTGRAPPAPAPSPGTPAVTESFSEGKRQMIANCGRKFQEAIYKPDPGCLYFDNNHGTSEKKVELWSRTSVVQIIPEYEDKPGLRIVASDGTVCTSDSTETCNGMIRARSIRDGEFIKFSVFVPPNQGMITQFNIN